MQTEQTDTEILNMYPLNELEPVLWQGIDQWLPEEGEEFYA